MRAIIFMAYPHFPYFTKLIAKPFLNIRNRKINIFFHADDTVLESVQGVTSRSKRSNDHYCQQEMFIINHAKTTLSLFGRHF